MPTTVQLPPALHERLSSLARRVRAQRVWRAACTIALVLPLTAAAALLADFLLGERLPSLVRGLALAGWLGLGVYLLANLRRVWRQPLDPAALAALIEQKHPELGERLCSSVELAQRADAGNGSPALIGLLVHETEVRSGRLDFRAALPAGPSRLLGGLAAAVLLVTLAPAAVAPGDYARLSQRFLLPWKAPHVPPDYLFEVTPGDTHAGRGRPLAVTAQVTPARDTAGTPEAVYLVATGEKGESRLEMHPSPEHPGKYLATLRVGADVKYRVEAGNDHSGTYTVTAVTPAELAADSPVITVTPPAYAKAAFETESYTGLVDLTALADSTISFEFTFSHPAKAARIEWTPGEGGAKKAAVVHPLALAEDGLSAALTLPAKETGAYRLVLEAEHGVLTERDGGTVTVKPDLPPAVVKFSPKEGDRTARRYGRVPLEVHLSDDVAVAGAELLYRVNDEKEPRAERLKLDGENTRDAVARHALQLAGKVKEGDTVHYRVRFRDNLPAELGGPHVRHHPETGWLAVRIADQDGSQREKEILARRDAVNKKLDEIAADVKQEKRRADRVRVESRDEEALAQPDREELRQLRQQNQGIEKALRDLAAEVAKEPELSPLAQAAEDLSRKEMKKADENLRDAMQEQTGRDGRNEKLAATDRNLDEALEKLGRLRKENERLARERADRAKVEDLADRQRDLAEQAAELEKDPDAKEKAEALAREQAEVQRQLEKLAADSEAVQKALEEARAERIRQAADRAGELAEAQRDLARASQETEKARRGEQLAELAEKQKDLAARTDKLARESAGPARANFSRPLSPEDAARARESLARGEAEKARAEQDLAARELDRLARDLDRAAESGREPRESARQLARLEEDLAKRARGASPEKAKELRAEQQAVREAAEKLSVPPGQNEALKKAAEPLAEAERLLEKGQTKEAAAEMEKAGKALRDLAGKMPALEQRRAAAKEQLERLRQEQERVARKAAEAGKQEEAAEEEAKLAKALEKLDVPGKEDLRDGTAKKMEEAAKDLRGGKKDEAREGMRNAGKKLEELAKALEGKENRPDPALPTEKQAEEARKLAREQRELREAVRKTEEQAQQERRADSGKDGPANKLAREQAEIAREAGKLARDVAREQGERSAPAERANQAGKSAQQAARGLEAGALPKAQEAGKQTAEELRKLAGDLVKAPRGEGKADTLDQARKLARRQEELNRQLGPAADSAAAQRARQQARQEELARDTAELRRQMEQAARAGRDPESQARTKEAAGAAQKAESSMQAARNQGQEGNQPGAQAQRELAAKALEQAAQAARRAAGERGNASPEAGRAVQQAREQMSEARGQLEQRQPGQARQSMEQAARSLEQASQQMARGMRPGGQGGPSPVGAPPGGTPDGKTLPPELKAFAGGRWGELPPAEQTKVVQQMRARYGDDYARMIKLYFEQIADTRKK